MAAVTMQMIDAYFDEGPGPRVVPKLRHKSGGLDPLGLGQVNYDLMDEALPGINNVTTLVRPYVVMSWAWWKAAELAKAEERKCIEVKALRDYAERVDLLFVLSQMLTGSGGELPGRRVLGELLERDSFDPGEARLKSFVQTRRNSTALMAAVQYGPSIKAQNGLGWLTADTDNDALVPVEEVMPAVHALDKRIEGYLPHALRNLAGGEVSKEELEGIAERWAADAPTEAEKKVFRSRFYGDGLDGPPRLEKRRAMLELMLVALRSLKRPATTDDVRRRMFLLEEPLAPETKRAQQVWIALQLRQLQRLAIEALFAFTEREMDRAGRPVSSRELARRADSLATEDLGLSQMSTVGEAMTPGQNNSSEELFELLESIMEAQGKDDVRLPGLALRAFALVCRTVTPLAAQEFPQELFGGQIDRLPLREFVKRITARSGDALEPFWREVIETWVLGQHVRWAVARNGDETQRLRVVLDEGGWVRLPRRPSKFGTTGDRLHTALSLAKMCGLIGLSDDGLWIGRQ